MMVVWLLVAAAALALRRQLNAWGRRDHEPKLLPAPMTVADECKCNPSVTCPACGRPPMPARPPRDDDYGNHRRRQRIALITFKRPCDALDAKHLRAAGFRPFTYISPEAEIAVEEYVRKKR